MLQYLPIDRSFRALAEPTRRAIVERLGDGPHSVSDLARPFDMSLTAVAQHIQVLEECGLVITSKVGRVRTCSLDPKGLEALSTWLDDRRHAAGQRLDRLGAVLDQMEKNERREGDDR